MNLMAAPEKVSLRIERIEWNGDRDAEAVRSWQRLRRAVAPVASVTSDAVFVRSE